MNTFLDIIQDALRIATFQTERYGRRTGRGRIGEVPMRFHHERRARRP